MDAQPQPQSIRFQPNTRAWNLALRIAFPFPMVYLGLYCLATQLITSLFSPTGGADIPDLATLWPLRPMISWTGAHILHVNAPLSFFFAGNSGTCDDIFGWVTVFFLLMMAAVATVVWSLLDRGRKNYAELHKWFRIFVRFMLAGQMIAYGFVKVFPLQMPYPSLTRLLQPFGTLSPFGVLLNSIGSAPFYESFTGCAMLAGGLLLVVPRTATLGALISLADMVQAFMLAITYDAPAKLLAFHLILLACFLLAPDVPRLVRLALCAQAQLFRSLRANRIALAAQLVLAAGLIGLYCHRSLEVWNTQGEGRPLPALYGIWEVGQMSIDKQPRLPLLTDSARWRRAIFDYPGQIVFERTDESFAPYGASVDLQQGTIALTKRGDENWAANFTFQRPAENQLILDGRMDNHQVHMTLRLTDRNSFLLVSRGFHWVQESKFFPSLD